MKKTLLIILLIIGFTLLGCKKQEKTEPKALEPDQTILPTESELTPTPIQTSGEDTPIVTELKYDVTINVGDKVLTIHDVNELDLKDIDKIEHYEYLGLYLDSEFTMEFSGKINSDLVLYMNYNIVYTVTIKNLGDDIELFIKDGEDIDLDSLVIPTGYDFDGLYLDNEYKEVFSGNINSDLVLYAKLLKYYYVNAYIDNELIDTKKVYENELYTGASIEENPRYESINLYTDEALTNLYDKSQAVNSNLDLYYGYTEKEEYVGLVIVNIHAGANIARIEMNKGEVLDYYDILFASFNNSLNNSLFLDPECTIGYKFGPVNHDLDLYQQTKSPSSGNFGIICECSYLDDGTSLGMQYKSYDIGEVYKKEDYGLYYNYVLEGVYLDQEFTQPYTDQVLEEGRFTLYGKFYKEVNDNLNVHKVTIYYGPANGNEINSSNVNKDEVYREFYIQDGSYIPFDSFKDKGQVNNLLFFDIYYFDTLNPYKCERIYEDTEFIVITLGLGGGQVQSRFNELELVNPDTLETYKFKYTKDSKTYHPE